MAPFLIWAPLNINLDSHFPGGISPAPYLYHSNFCLNLLSIRFEKVNLEGVGSKITLNIML